MEDQAPPKHRCLALEAIAHVHNCSCLRLSTITTRLPSLLQAKPAARMPVIRNVFLCFQNWATLQEACRQKNMVIKSNETITDAKNHGNGMQVAQRVWTHTNVF
jgi:hypothetical protein